MRMKTNVLGVVLGLLLVLGEQAFAWNERGHMSVAYVAYKQLTPAARERVNVLLKLIRNTTIGRRR